MDDQSVPPPVVDDMYRAFRKSSVVRHLRELSEWATAELYGAVQEAGFHEIRRVHELVFEPMELSGTRLVDIARSSKVSKNAIGQLANELEGAGYVRRIDDREDRRAKRLEPTHKGIAMLEEAMTASLALEKEIVRMIGSANARQLGLLLAMLTTEVRLRADR